MPRVTPVPTAYFRWRDTRWSVASDHHRFVGLVAELFAPLSVGDWDHQPPSSRMAQTTPRSIPVVSYDVQPPSNGAPGQLLRDGRVIRRSNMPARLLGSLIGAINQQVIGAEPDALRLHAAGAADDAGRVVALPAVMEGGKTTLVTALLDRGLAYLSDEALTIDNDLYAHGYAKPLSIDPGSWELLAHHRPRWDPALAPFFADQWQVPPHRFTSVMTTGRLVALVFPRYEPEATTSLVALSGADALELAMESTFHLDGGPLPTTRVRDLARMVSAVPTYRLVSGRLDEAADRVEKVLAAAPERVVENPQQRTPPQS